VKLSRTCWPIRLNDKQYQESIPELPWPLIAVRPSGIVYAPLKLGLLHQKA